jgi:hypothetical protein
MPTNTTKTYVLRGGTYPKDSIEVDTEAGTFYRSGGGFVRNIADLKRFNEDFRPATEEELNYNPPFRKGRFSIEMMDEDKPFLCVDGYTMGFLWNGWAMPVFDKENAEKILKATDAKYRYDEATDTFSWIVLDGEEEDSTQGSIIHVDGVPVKVYSIGAGSWTWDEVTDPEQVGDVEE